MTWLAASSEPPTGVRQRPPGAWLSVVLFSGVGLALLSAPWWAYDEPAGGRPRTGLVLFGLAVLTVPLCTYAVRLHRPRNRVTRVAGTDAGIEVRLSNHLLLTVVITSLVWTIFLLWAAVAAGLAGAGLLVLLFAIPFAALLPDTVRALLRGPRLTLSSGGVTFVGWSNDATVSWHDIAGVDLAAPHVRRPVVRIAVRPGATSFRSTSRRLLVPLDRPPDLPAIDVPLLALGSPGRLATLLDRLAGSGDADRTRWLGADGVRFLEDQSPARTAGGRPGTA